jgi:hypothetical protein
MYWRLSDSVTACVAAQRILFLDVALDRYRSLPAGNTEGFRSWLQSPGGDPPASCGALLSELRIDARASRSSGFPLPCFVASPRPFDSERLPSADLGAGDLLSVGRALVSAARDVRSRPLGGLLQRRLSNRTRHKGASADLKSKLAIFRSARPLIPVPRVCLHDCLALIDWLGPTGAGIALVFGVSAYPFTAHCWLQAGDEVIDDHPESPSRFEPILHFE